jgi:hypothetical protein
MHQLYVLEIRIQILLHLRPRDQHSSGTVKASSGLAASISAIFRCTVPKALLVSVSFGRICTQRKQLSYGNSLSVNLLCLSLRLLKSSRLAFSLAFSPAALLIAVRSILASGVVNRRLSSRLGCSRSIIMVFTFCSHLYRALRLLRLGCKHLF